MRTNLYELPLLAEKELKLSEKSGIHDPPISKDFVTTNEP
jgi:hypothetical protein